MQTGNQFLLGQLQTDMKAGRPIGIGQAFQALVEFHGCRKIAVGFGVQSGLPKQLSIVGRRRARVVNNRRRSSDDYWLRRRRRQR